MYKRTFECDKKREKKGGGEKKNVMPRGFELQASNQKLVHPAN
jgi:hypothetical protein